MLKIESIDWHLLENSKEHHTDRYEIIHEESTPVLRRAQPFRLSLIFNRPFNEAVDKIKLLFSIDFASEEAIQPRLEATLENTSLISSNKLTESLMLWSLQLDHQKGNALSLMIRSPPIAAFGLWNLSVKLGHVSYPEIIMWKCPTQFWLLFNPWAKDDAVFMPEMRYLDEYILNDVGKVYTSSAKKPMGMKWIYGQFASPSLKAIKKFLDHSFYDESQLGSPIHLTKAIRKMETIIIGNWGGPYDGGTAPWLWTGSIPIFEEYLRTGQYVKWSQCYVYAGLLTTALRAVGIPSRNVSNFVSSSTGSLTMSCNFTYDSNGEALDSPLIWNFHVWNDAWMSRSDLPVGYGGWQAVDSAGLGPAPLEAIKRGEICLNYHVRHIMAACNADRVRWTKDLNGEFHLVNVDIDYVGQAMLTKQPFIFDPHGDTDFMDITSLYKEQEGSKEERLSVYNAMKYSAQFEDNFDERLEGLPVETRAEILKLMGINRKYIEILKEDETVKFQLVQLESVTFGRNFSAVLKIQNLKETTITVEACLGIRSIYYNGATAGRIKNESKTIIIKPNSEELVSMLIKPEEYADKLVQFTLLNIHCIATVKENNFTWADDFQFNIEMPQLVITAKKDLKLNQEGIILFQIKNQLKSKLTRCSITYEAPGIGRNIQISVRDIKEGEEAIIEHKVRAFKSGEIQINAMFSSNQLTFLSGSATLNAY